MKPLRIAIAGLGTVGCGVVRILSEQAQTIEARCGRRIEIVAVSARTKKKKRGCDVSGYRFAESAESVAFLPDVDVVCELIGGTEGPARKLVEGALKNGKHVVTANKALIAHHGMALAALAEKNKVTFAYEAAVAGGIPIIKTLREGLAANRFTQVMGILNGTCNYILTTMWEQKRDFADVLKEAQKLGYAEADPTFDVDGIDTAHKLAILATLAYGIPLSIGDVQAEGIRSITLRDMQFADELGYAIKLLGVASRNGEAVRMRVAPCMVPLSSPISRVGGAYNAIVAEGDAVGRIMLEGAGAGALPTASSVVSDLMDIARGVSYPPFVLPVARLKKPAKSADNAEASFYLRLSVLDRSGVLADITERFRKAKISVQSFIQHSHAPNEAVQVVLTTHKTRESAMQQALGEIAKLKTVVEKPTLIRIEEI